MLVRLPADQRSDIEAFDQIFHFILSIASAERRISLLYIRWSYCHAIQRCSRGYTCLARVTSILSPQVQNCVLKLNLGFSLIIYITTAYLLMIYVPTCVLMFNASTELVYIPPILALFVHKQ
jgi:hypothetical protein